MAQIYDAGEIFEMAVQMEVNGAEFYRKAAEGVSDSSNKELLLNLAEMEVVHREIFTALQKELSADLSDYFDPTGEAVKYIRAIADTKIFFERKIDTTTIEGILKEAIQAEKDSTIFYLGMKDMVPSEEGKAKIESIIAEEMGHVRILSELLVEVKS